MKQCPYCGSDLGLYRNYTGTQYYNWDGSPAGCNADCAEKQAIYAMCIRCGKRFNLSRIERLANSEEGLHGLQKTD